MANMSVNSDTGMQDVLRRLDESAAESGFRAGALGQETDVAAIVIPELRALGVQLHGDPGAGSATADDRVRTLTDRLAEERRKLEGLNEQEARPVPPAPSAASWPTPRTSIVAFFSMVLAALCLEFFGKVALGLRGWSIFVVSGVLLLAIAPWLVAIPRRLARRLLPLRRWLARMIQTRRCDAAETRLRDWIDHRDEQDRHRARIDAWVSEHVRRLCAIYQEYRAYGCQISLVNPTIVAAYRNLADLGATGEGATQ